MSEITPPERAWHGPAMEPTSVAAEWYPDNPDDGERSAMRVAVIVEGTIRIRETEAALRHLAGEIIEFYE